MALREVRINVRTTEEIKHDLEIAAGLRGLTVSSLVNSLAVRAIREEKQIAPQAFEKQNRPRTVGSRTRKAKSWSEALKNAKGIWKDRDDLPDLRQLRAESDRFERWSSESD